MAFEFLKKLIGKKEEEQAPDAGDLLKQSGMSMPKLLSQARKNPQVMSYVKTLMERMEKEGVDVNNAGKVKEWVAKNKSKLEQEAKASEPAKVETVVHEGPDVGRNDPCFCGSGKKFKKCCLNKTLAKK